MPCVTDTRRRTSFVLLLVFVALEVTLQGQTPSTNQAASPSPAIATADFQDETGDEALPHFHRVDARLFRGAQPRSGGGITKLAALGINTVINLRSSDGRARVEERAARAAGMRYFNIPFKRLGKPTDENMTRVLAIINAPESGKVFIHCARGADRTGTVIAIYRITHDNWTSERAQQEANRYGMRVWQRGMKHYIRNYRSDIANKSRFEECR